MPIFSHQLDTSGLQCPLPLLHLKKILATMDSGDIVQITVTDNAAHLDFGVYCQQVGHAILTIDKQESRQIFYIQKG